MAHPMRHNTISPLASRESSKPQNSARSNIIELRSTPVHSEPPEPEDRRTPIERHLDNYWERHLCSTKDDEEVSYSIA